MVLAGISKPCTMPCCTAMYSSLMDTVTVAAPKACQVFWKVSTSGQRTFMPLMSSKELKGTVEHITR